MLLIKFSFEQYFEKLTQAVKIVGCRVLPSTSRGHYPQLNMEGFLDNS